MIHYLEKRPSSESKSNHPHMFRMKTRRLNPHIRATFLPAHLPSVDISGFLKYNVSYTEINECAAKIWGTLQAETEKKKSLLWSTENPSSFLCCTKYTWIRLLKIRHKWPFVISKITADGSEPKASFDELCLKRTNPLSFLYPFHPNIFIHVWRYTSWNNSLLHTTPWVWTHLRGHMAQGSLLALNAAQVWRFLLIFPSQAHPKAFLWLRWQHMQNSKDGSLPLKENERGVSKEVWLTSLIPLRHSAAFQIDLHTAQCPFSLCLAVVGALRGMEAAEPKQAAGKQNEGGKSRENNSEVPFKK